MSLRASALLLAAAAAASAAEPSARDILDATGVKGGLIVHLGCGNGTLTAALAGQGRPAYIVHGLDPDPTNVEKARAHVRSLGLYGKAAIERLGRSLALPYTDNLVNLIVASGECRVPNEEILRVLAPNGVALIGGKKTVKPRPKEIDEWTHALHDASNNAVANDALVGPPRHLQWVSGPRWARSHDQLSSTSAVVTSGGRIFAIIDEGPIAAVALPPAWFLVARDAFNGVLLWKRPIGPWENHLRGFRSGPPELSRRLVAIGDRVFVTLGYGKPVTALDAATGETLKTYEGTEGTREILWHEGTLLLAVAETDAKHAAEPGKQVGEWLFWPEHEKAEPAKHLLALKAETGEGLWRKPDAELGGLMPMTLAAAGDKVFYQSTSAVVCLDAASGRELWRTPRPTPLARPAWSAPTLVVHGGIVYSADRGRPAPSPKAKEEPDPKGLQRTVSSRGGMAPVGELIALSAETGKELWRTTCRECYNAPADLLVAGGRVWTGDLVNNKDPGITAARDPATGEAKLKREPDPTQWTVGMFHHRCYRNKATGRYLLLGRAGVEFLDTATGALTPHHWVRGACQYGIVPANGLLYAPHHACACYIQAKLTGFNALSATRSALRPGGERLERGPAYGADDRRQMTDDRAGEWPTYRHDAARSGSTPSTVPGELKPAWEAALGGRLAPPVVADGRVFVASTDVHAVHCVHADSGKPLWSFTAGGRVDGPPTIAGGLALFGSADGYVYALRTSDGALAWRFRAAPHDLRTVAYDQIESIWPVHGSVLVEDGVASFAAGRSSFLDGGIRLCRLDAKTGKLLAEKTLSSRDPKTGEEPQATIRGFDMPGALPDVLSSDGTSLFMRHVRLDRSLAEQPTGARHLFSSAGFVDDSWWHRTYWLLAARMESGWSGWIVAGNQAPAGRILVFDANSVYGYGRDRYGLDGSHVGLGKATHRLFACAREPKVIRPGEAPAAKTESDLDKGKAPKAKAKGQPAQPRIETRWTQPVPLLVRAMVLADKTLFIAGPPDVSAGGDGSVGGVSPRRESRDGDVPPTTAGSKGGLLWAVAAHDGAKLAELKLASPPVHDGLIAASGRLYAATLDGKLHCLKGEAK
ncbi:MAG: methyltransferase domain-containing protein [Planctomycetes bacterium]|nr:methyltransferase domain-containing protein [Planctomycetota bacterium]